MDIPTKIENLDEIEILIEECCDELTSPGTVLIAIIKRVLGKHPQNTDPLRLCTRVGLYTTIIKFLEMNILFSRDAKDHIQDFLAEEARMILDLGNAIECAHLHKHRLPQDAREAVETAMKVIEHHREYQEMKEWQKKKSFQESLESSDKRDTAKT